jgi:phosphoglycolate phosphatase-like HAD superfamily hydrolase
MPIARTLFVESKKLRIFDFDDTLVKTNSFIYVTHRNGMKTKLSPGQYAKNDTRDGDSFVFIPFL